MSICQPLHTRRTLWPALVVGAVLALPPLLTAQKPRSYQGSWHADSVAVRAALRRFMTAFENLDWDPFRSAFSDSATVFHPAPDTPERVMGRVAIEESFAKVFAAIRAAAPSWPPYQRLEAEDLE